VLSLINVDTIPGREPTANEIRRAVMATSDGESGGDAKLPVEYWKAISSDQLFLGYLL
jgi:hypothetical protein